MLSPTTGISMASNMPLFRFRRVLLFVAFAVSVYLLSHSLMVRSSWRALPLEKIGLGDLRIPTGGAIQNGNADATGSSDNQHSGNGASSTPPQEGDSFEKFHPKGGFQPGKVKAKDATYSKMLVIPRTTKENVTWLTEALNHSSSTSSPFNTSIYIADDPSAPLHPPQNKGHEGMIYLTYIIDHYESLNDITLFMHSHSHAWHNNAILSLSALESITRLSPAHITRTGFANLRCDWHPGCPHWLRPAATTEDANKKEEVEFARAWAELFPGDAVPRVVAAACCAQFAVSAERIRALPREKYVRLREWLVRTPLRDSISGRVWEYLWHWVFTGQAEVCPAEHICYCETYGVCFGSAAAYEAWWERMWERRRCDEQLLAWRENATALRAAEEQGRPEEELRALWRPVVGLDGELQGKIEVLDTWLEGEKSRAIERGEDPRNRALEAGRPWKEGDGF